MAPARHATPPSRRPELYESVREAVAERLPRLKVVVVDKNSLKVRVLGAAGWQAEPRAEQGGVAVEFTCCSMTTETIRDGALWVCVWELAWMRGLDVCVAIRVRLEGPCRMHTATRTAVEGKGLRCIASRLPPLTLPTVMPAPYVPCPAPPQHTMPCQVNQVWFSLGWYLQPTPPPHQVVHTLHHPDGRPPLTAPQPQPRAAVLQLRQQPQPPQPRGQGGAKPAAAAATATATAAAAVVTPWLFVDDVRNYPRISDELCRLFTCAAAAAGGGGAAGAAGVGAAAAAAAAQRQLDRGLADFLRTLILTHEAVGGPQLGGWAGWLAATLSRLLLKPLCAGVRYSVHSRGRTCRVALLRDVGRKLRPCHLTPHALPPPHPHPQDQDPERDAKREAAEAFAADSGCPPLPEGEPEWEVRRGGV